MSTFRRRGLQFEIHPQEAYSQWWFQQHFATWEPQTFEVLDRFLRPDRDYLDIGAWIGPTVLYAAQCSRKVYALEPDPVAFQRLQANVQANRQANAAGFEGVQLYPLALADRNGRLRFGGNGEWGNSESTLLVNDAQFLQFGGGQAHWRGDDPHWRQGQQTEVSCLTLKAFLDREGVNPADLALIKMDIEGSEKWVLPTLAEALGAVRPPLYLSLHRVFLQPTEVAALVEILEELYPHLCTPRLRPVTPVEIQAEALEELLCLQDLPDA